MRGDYRILIRVSILLIGIVVRYVYRNSKKGPKELSISSTLVVANGLTERLQLKPGEMVSLVNRPDTFEVLVSAKGTSDRYEQIGVIEDRELAEKVKSATARGYIEHATGNDVKVKLTY